VPKFLDVTDKAAARTFVDVYSREQTVGPGDALPNECGFWWVSEPAAVAGKVYMGTCAADRGSWVQEWTQPVEGGPFYLHRYFMGYTELSTYGAPDLRDDHNPAQCAVKAGKPLVAFWSSHGVNSRFYYRISDQNVDEARPGELTFGPIKTHAVEADERTSYTQVMHHGDDIWVAHRTGYTVNKWSLTKFPDWGTGTPVQHDLVFTAPSGGQDNQLYIKARIVDGVIRCMVANGPLASVHNKLWWFEVDLDSGDVTEADGTVLGNLDGTNLPLEANVDLEVVRDPGSGNAPFLFDVGHGVTREMTFMEGSLSNLAATMTYKHARWTGSAWSVNTITTVNQPSNQVTYFPIINFVPDEPAAVILTRAEPATTTTGIHNVEKWTTGDSGATWTKAATVDSASYDATGAGDRRALARAFPVRVESGSSPFDVIAAEIIDFPRYFSGWEIYPRPLPLSHPVRRVPKADPIRTGLETEPSSPQTGLYLPGTTGHYIEGPTDAGTVPTDGIRLEVDVALPDWTPDTEVTLLGREKNATTRELRLVLSGAVGRLGVCWSEDGSTLQWLVPNQVPTPAFEPWQRVQIAVEFIPSHAHPTIAGTFQRTMRSFYRFNDSEPWTTLSVTQISPATSVFVGDSPWEIGGRQLGTVDQQAGVYYRAAVMTVGGEVLAEWRADKPSDQGIQVDPQGNTWTIKSRDAILTSPVVTNLKTSSVIDPETNIIVAQFGTTATTANPNRLQIRSSDTNPNILAVGPSSNPDVPIVLIPKGASAVRVLATGTPELQGWGGAGNNDFDITTQSSGRVLANGLPVIPFDLTSGENTISRREINTNGAALSNGQLRLTYFTAKRTELVASVRVIVNTAQVGATLARIGVYEVNDSTGGLTLVASTANDTALWSSTGPITKALSASFTKTRGKRYAVGLLVVGTSTAPQFSGSAAINSTEAAEPPRQTGVLLTQTDLTTPISNASLTASGSQFYAALVP